MTEYSIDLVIWLSPATSTSPPCLTLLLQRTRLFLSPRLLTFALFYSCCMYCASVCVYEEVESMHAVSCLSTGLMNLQWFQGPSDRLSAVLQVPRVVDESKGGHIILPWRCVEVALVHSIGLFREWVLWFGARDEKGVMTGQERGGSTSDWVD